MKIVKTLYVPNGSYIDINVRTLIEWIRIINNNYVNTSDNVEIELIGWVNDIKDLPIIIDDIIEATFVSIDIDIIYNIKNENHGKLWILNDISERYTEPFLYIEHDIYPNDFNINSIDFSIFDMLTNLLFVSYDQEGDSRTNDAIYDSSLVEILNSKYYFPDNQIMYNGFVPTGCCMLKPLEHELKSINIYGDEDYVLAKYAKDHEKIIIMSNMKIYHEYENNVDYIKWKQCKIYSIFVDKINDNDSFY